MRFKKGNKKVFAVFYGLFLFFAMRIILKCLVCFAKICSFIEISLFFNKKTLIVLRKKKQKPSPVGEGGPRQRWMRCYNHKWKRKLSCDVFFPH